MMPIRTRPVQATTHSAWYALRFAAMMFAAVFGQVGGAAADGGEGALKAAYLYNFAVYTDWPVLPTTFEFCIAGKDDFGDSLDAIARKQISGRQIRIRRFQGGDVPGECNLVFIVASNRVAGSQVLAAVARRPVLTVGDVGLETDDRPMLQLARENGQLCFSVNQPAAHAVGLTFSSKMLRLARSVQ
ncbi:YfiR family protein [Azoarcus sp. KH32C]|uniref:YfiR family protein n=1 Tax=Azoarcus sp. KH32C TaxID=748247 RepID=UPI0002386EBA|nr:YfiR family protein [Azoarcus sp. KH32C]BAL24434.1 hypothetical protein AZKH_2121 [Azoarcus sp. KH32C]